MIDWYKFILKIKPDGKALRSILFSKKLYEVLAYGFSLIKDYAVLTINDQVWYVNSNFNPEPWERRFEIDVPEFTTLEKRRQVVKSYMLFPQSENRLSRDYIQRTLDEAGYTNLLVEYNPTNISEGYFRTNDISNEKLVFSLGTNDYNQFLVSGEIAASDYWNAIYLIMSVKPLQVGFYETIETNFAIALDDNFAIALDDNFALALTKL